MLDVAVRRLTDGMVEVDQLPQGGGRDKKIRSVLMEVHGDVIRAAAGADSAASHELDDLVALVRSLVPAGVEDGLAIRERIFVRLLRTGKVEPAWTLAEDNSAGVVRTARAGMTWAGGQATNVALPLPTVVQSDRVYVWLPGFRDPRWDIPDGVYDVTASVRLSIVLEQFSLEDGRLQLAGSAHFGVLAASASDAVTVVLSEAGGREHRLPAERARTSEYVAQTGPALTRLAWAGWHAAIDLSALGIAPGEWAISVELAEGGLRRDRPLGLERGSYAAVVRQSGPAEARGRVFRLVSGREGQLSLTVTQLGWSARVVPQPLRAGLRRLVPRR